MIKKCDRIDKMKKVFFFAIASVAMFTSCSSEDALASDEEKTPYQGVATVVVENSDVPIRLSPNANANGGGMRSAILSDPSDMTFELDGLGVFGIAYEKQSSSSLATAIDWTTSGNAFNYCLDNVRANAVKVQKTIIKRDGDGNIIYNEETGEVERIPVVRESDGTLIPEYITDIQWADNLIRYYPMGAWYKYNFYAYYPYENTVISKGSGQVNATMTIDGTTDIIWGRTRPNAEEQGENAYSANYFRVDNNADTIPVLIMNHVLTRFRFKAIAGEPYPTGENVESQGIKIVDIQVHDVPTRVTLAIARQNEATHGWGDSSIPQDTEGTLSQVSSPSVLHLKEDGVALTEYGGYLGSPYTLLNSHNAEHPLYIHTGDNTSDTDVSDGMMVPAGEREYSLTVTMIDRNYDTTHETYTNEVPFKLIPPEGGYLPGRVYWIELTINPRKEISARAVLIPWRDAETGPIGLEF